MKALSFFCFLAFVLLLANNNSFAQCNFSDSDLKVGQLLSTPASCPSSGSITVSNVTGGGGTYVYEIVDGPVVRIIQSQNVFNALPMGNYLVRVSSCNGDVFEKSIYVGGGYISLYQSGWQNSLKKISGLNCGVANDGVYKLFKPSYTGGTAPFRIQLSPTSSFNSVPFQPGNDSALFTGLNQSTTYYIRITDACNNFITFNFTTPPATPAAPVNVPTLSFQRAIYFKVCSGQETIYIDFKDSASGGNYNGSYVANNATIWGNRERPYLRMKIEDRVTNEVYMDRNITVSYPSANTYGMYTDLSINGETGLAAPGSGMSTYASSGTGVNKLPRIYPNSSFPLNAKLKITIYFPGGNNCGTIIPPYSKSFWFDLGTTLQSNFKITAITPNCAGYGNYFKVDFNRSDAGDTISLVGVSPYEVLTKLPFSSSNNTYYNLIYNPLVPGKTYRVVIKDTCGRSDSMSVVYNPSGAIVPAPPVVDEPKVDFRCPSNPNDTIYSIIVHGLPSGYSVLNIKLDGNPSSYYNSIYNWQGTTETVYQIYPKLPPGTYSYKVYWLNNCQTGVVSKTITINPESSPPSYSADMSLSLYTQPGACNKDGYKAIVVNGYLKNNKTDYTIENLRLVSGPNAHIYPIYDRVGTRLDSADASIYLWTPLVNDTLKIRSEYSGLIIGAGQEGMYTIAVDIVCPDGTLVETLTRTINVAATEPSVPYYPSLKYSNALTCGSGGSQVNINMIVDGGKRPFVYEFKRDTATSYQFTTNSGVDSNIVISPAPAPGTIYDLRVTDACGITSTSRVTVASFTGEFFLYSYPADCTNNPFNTRVGTSWIRGAYYTWRRNGLIVAQDYNIPYVNLIGVTTDSVTVDVNLYNCYSGSAERRIVSPNPCNVIVLSVNALNLTGSRITPFNVQLNWKSTNENKSINYFQLEKSFDGTSFTVMSKIKADENPWEHSYVYNDPESAPVVYYRLRITSTDGKEFVTSVLRIENKKVSKPMVTIWPNPARDNISLAINADNIKSYKAKVFNDKGQMVKEITISQDEVAEKKVDISMLSTGSYFVSIIDNWEIVATAKFIKQ